MKDPLPLPERFAVGHWTDRESRTGCTVVIAPAGTRAAVDVRGGGTGTRELETLSPLANAEGPTAVLLTGGARSDWRPRTAWCAGSSAGAWAGRRLWA